MKKFALLGIIIAAGLLLSGFAAAYRGNMELTGPNYNPELHEKLEQAIESGNYAEWKKLREENNLPMRGRIFQVVNESNFSTFSELHKAIESGDTAKANELRQKLGLGTPNPNYQGQGKGFGKNGKGMGNRQSDQGCMRAN